MNQPRLAEFGRIDQTGDADYFVRFLDAACAAASVQAYKRRMLERLDLALGRQVLDVGCGTGDDVREMAKAVGQDGRVIGIDNGAAMIEVARTRAAALAGIGGEVSAFEVGDVLDLPFEAARFDGARADRSLMHVPDARQALAEMVRVTRPGRPIVIYEVDFETLTVDVADRVLARKIINTWCDGFRNGWLGRHIPALLAELGVKDIDVEPFTLVLAPELALPLLGSGTAQQAVKNGAISDEEATRWLAQLENLQNAGRFFSTLTGFLVAGRRP